LVKKTLGGFDVTIKSLYTYGIYVIDTFWEHCKLLALAEEEDIGVPMDQLPDITNKRQFEHYIVESKNFKALYLEGNQQVEELNAVPTWEQLQKTREDCSRNRVKDEEKEVREIEAKVRIAYHQSIAQVLGRAYFTCKIFHFCLFWSRTDFGVSLVENKCALLHVIKSVCDLHRV